MVYLNFKLHTWLSWLNLIKTDFILLKFALCITLFSSSFVSKLKAQDDSHTHDATQKTSEADSKTLIPLAKESQLLLGIITEIASKRKMSQTVRTTGRIIPRTQSKANISSPQPGRIVANTKYPMPNIGDRVKKGQAVAVIELNMSAAEQLQVLAEKVKVDAELEQAQQEYKRLNSISGLVSQKQLQAAEIRLRAAQRAQRLYHSSTVKINQGDNTTHFVITTPISGIVTATKVTVGEQAESNKTLFEVVDLDKLWVEAQIYETDLAQVEKAGYAKITTQAYQGTIFNGKLFNLGHVVDPQTRTIRALFEVDNTTGKLRIGMFADVAIAVSDADSLVAVPRSAVIDVSGKNVVFTHIAPEYFYGNEVLIGSQDGEFIEIKSGIQLGDRVVTEGNYQLKAVLQQGK